MERERNRAMKKILLSMTLIFVLIMTVLPSTVYAKSEKPSRITISGSHYVAKGKKISLSANVFPAGANKKVTWKTSNKKIATITGKGVVAGKKSGKVKITVISKANKKVKKTFKITVKEKAATGVTISNAPEKMSIGQSVKLKAIIKPSKAAQSVRWSVSNKNASVSSDGTVKALRKGTVNITAAATDGSNKKDFVTISVENPARKVEKTAIQAQEPRYVPIDEVGSFNSKIITPELMKSCTLPNLDKSALPYWTGVISENKISVNFHTEGWDEYTAGDTYWNEQELQYLADNGFNCIRVCYSLSYLSNPENVNLINVSELEQLDELISWCMKHNLHLIFSQTGLPGKWGSWGANWYPDYEYWNTQENVVNNTELYTSEKMQKTYKAYYDMLARRYKDIPNGVLSFELAVESTVPDNDMDLQTRVLGPVAETIWSYTPDRIVIVNDLQHTVPKKLAEMGCCISLHNHIYSINGRPIKDMFGVSYDPHWPMQYLPSMVLNDQTSPLIIQAEEKFSKGEFKIYAQYRNGWPVVLIDGKVVFVPLETASDSV